MLLTEHPLLERPAAARRAGFNAVEFWWPFAEPVPDDRDVEAFIAAVEQADVELVNLNLFGGDMAAGERGLISSPERSSEFRDNLDVIVEIGRRLRCRRFNALYGNRIDGVAAEVQDELGAEQLACAAKAVAEFGGVILVEPLSGVASYPLRSADDVIAVIDRAGQPNIGMLADLYHLSVNGAPVAEIIATNVDRVAHVQIADAPGRGKPGTGSLPLRQFVTDLAQRGYTGWVALEYAGSGSSEHDFNWLTAGHLG